MPVLILQVMCFISITNIRQMMMFKKEVADCSGNQTKHTNKSPELFFVLFNIKARWGHVVVFFFFFLFSLVWVETEPTWYVGHYWPSVRALDDRW